MRIIRNPRESVAVMEGDEALIDAVRAFPCLYNSKIAEFRVVTKKENAWKAVSMQLGKSSKP